MEGRKRITAAFLLVLACCWLLVLSHGGLAQTWQKVVPSGGSCSGSESSVPTYLGVTSQSYNGGAVGGYIGANAKCVAQYGAGARMMTIIDNIKMKRSINYPNYGWVDGRPPLSYSVNFRTSEYVSDDYSHCRGYSYGTYNVSITGYSIGTAGNISILTCDNALPIHCVKD